MTKQFPIKIGNNANVAKYASTLTNGEEQLLITRQGEMFVTDGMGGYTQCGESSNSSEVVEGHTHDNKEVIDMLTDTSGVLTYKGKTVVNDSNLMFKTLPSFEKFVGAKYNNEEGAKLPWLY